MISKVLVTGGAGFVGSHLVEASLERGWGVDVYDNFTKGRRDYLPDDDRVAIIEGDILATGSLREAIDASSPDVVFHLAAVHYIPECEENPSHALRVNVEGTQSVLDACGSTDARLVFASTGAIYDPEIEVALDEASNIRTADIYGITKHTCEELVKYWVDKRHRSAIIARLFNAVGTRETNWHLVPAIMDQLLNGVRRIELGNLYPRRDYVHVHDIADALVALAMAPMEEDLETFNIGSGVEHTVSELVEMCADVIGEPIAVESVASRRRTYDRANQLADIRRIRTRTGWSPSRDVKQALSEVWQEVLHAAVWGGREE